MSRAFVKEPEGEAAGDDQPELPISPHPNYVTPDGLAALEARLAALRGERKEVTAGADRLINQATLRSVEREIRYLERRLGSAIRVDPAAQPHDRVAFGATVEVAEESGDVRLYRIVGEDQADAERGWVSYVSPLARALLEAEVGDLVVWQKPTGDLELEIVSVRY